MRSSKGLDECKRGREEEKRRNRQVAMVAVLDRGRDGERRGVLRGRLKSE